MRYYRDPEIKDVLTEIGVVQKQLDELKPKLVTGERIAHLLGWATLKKDVEDIKEELATLNKRLTRAGL